MASVACSSCNPTGSETVHHVSSVSAPRTSSSNCIPAYARQWPSSPASDLPAAVQVRWVDHDIGFSTLDGSGRNVANPPSGMEAVQALAPRGLRSTRNGASDAEPRPVVCLPQSFTFTCTQCASRLVMTNVAATKSMVVECSACHCTMSPQFPAAEEARSQGPAIRGPTALIGKKPRRARGSAGDKGEDGDRARDNGVPSSHDGPSHDLPVHAPEEMSGGSSLASPRMPVSPRDIHAHSAAGTSSIRRSHSFGRALNAFSKAFGAPTPPVMAGADDPAASANRAAEAGRAMAATSGLSHQHPLDTKPKLPGTEGLALPCVDMVQPLVLPLSAAVLMSPKAEHPLGNSFAPPPSPPPTPPGGTDAERAPEKSSRGKGLGNFARAASFSKAFASKSKSKSASRSATAPKGAIPAEVAKAKAAAAASAATEAPVEPPRANEPAKAPAGTAAAPASVLSGQKKRTGSFGGRKTPPRRSHCSASSTEGSRQLVNADGKPTENTPRCGDFEEYESESSDFSEDEGPMPGQAVTSAAFDDISGRLSGGDFVFSL